MNTSLIEELLESKARVLEQAGMDRCVAVDLAGEDLLRSLERRSEGAELFCYRALVAGAGGRIKLGRLDGPGSAFSFAALPRRTLAGRRESLLA